MRDNQQLLRSLRAALAIADDEMEAIFRLSGLEPGHRELAGLPWQGDAAAGACSDLLVRHFLEGFILSERGPPASGAAMTIEDAPLSNNQVLKKLRIALNLQEQDMLAIFAEGGADLSAGEFGALFRKESNKHFRPCSDSLLQSFLAGLSPSLDA